MLKEELEDTAKQYKDCIFSIAYNYLKNSYDADDIVQNVLIRYCNNKKHLESEEHKKNWLIRVTINECRKMLISPWRKRFQYIEDYADTLKFEEKEQSELFFAVMALPGKYRTVVHLYYYEGYSVREIAQILSIRETAVSTRMLRARRILKEKLQEVWNEE